VDSALSLVSCNIKNTEDKIVTINTNDNAFSLLIVLFAAFNVARFCDYKKELLCLLSLLLLKRR
jgi:hypothetical protein